MLRNIRIVSAVHVIKGVTMTVEFMEPVDQTTVVSVMLVGWAKTAPQTVAVMGIASVQKGLVFVTGVKVK